MTNKIRKFIDDTGGIRYVLLLMIFAVFPTFFSSSVIYFFRDKFFTDAIEWHDALMFFLFSILVMSLALTPTTLVAILSGYFFDWTGLVPLLLAYMAACVLGLQTGRLLNRFIVGKWLFQNKKLQLFFEKLHQHEFLLVFFGRLSPVLPFAMMNIAFASIKLNMRRYLLASITGAFPRTFLFFYIGRNATEIWDFVLHPTLEGSVSLIPLILVIVSSLGLIWILRNILQPVDLNKFL
jgi:uncharacterized membrane protein YdjX (TVP38/TMEM64 family)